MIMWVSDINQKGFGTWWLQESPWSYIKTGNDRNTYSWRLFEWFKLEEHSTAATCHCPIFCWSRNCSHCSTYRVLLPIFSGFFLGISVLWPNQLLVNAKDDLTDSRMLENTSFTKQPNMPNIPHSLLTWFSDIPLPNIFPMAHDWIQTIQIASPSPAVLLQGAASEACGLSVARLGSI